ncbi:CHC2 zinc finger domain-containing protein [Enterocloster clostridioformis]|uniref:CHC2 zinc finger domain-containing protein n=1 Tax=Enterocloster clostridioformis TaxID=1531 RepID=UPI0026764665|nr:CHC2 zinc finger domain-containing protein [Enterocloster clostridioformis]
MNVFEAVKQSVPTRQAAEHYGIKVSRNGMCACPFHNDKNPSMKVDRRFYCFGCGATGDVIDFASRLHGISGREAALMLAQDFSIPYEDRKNAAKTPIKPRLRQETEEQRFRRMEKHCFLVLSDYYHLLRRWKQEYAPRQPGEAWNPRFVEALQGLSHVEYLLDGLLSGDMQQRASLIIEYGKEVKRIEQRMAGLAAPDTAGYQTAGRQHRATPER